jgi:hypothetical protein
LNFRARVCYKVPLSNSDILISDPMLEICFKAALQSDLLRALAAKTMWSLDCSAASTNAYLLSYCSISLL